ncbi:MAG: PAS domain-containing protein [Dehalococcoidia bacterium]|nr:PAS domain-containing protein [Dehalococcoidia bacterium]
MTDNSSSMHHGNGSGSLSRRLRNGDEQLRPLISGILSDISDTVLQMDMNGTVLAGNAAAARLLGVRTRQLAGIRLGDLLEPATLQSLCERAAARLRPVVSGSLLTLRLSDGSERAVSAVVRPVNEGATQAGYLVTLREHTVEKQLADDLRKVTNEKREAHEWERTRLSRRLHDEVLQDMLALAINVECLPDRCHGAVEQCTARALAAQAREVADHVRHMAHAMRPGILDRMPLVPALRTIVREANTDSLRATLRVRGKIVPMPWSAESTLYRIALELLTNVRKHSGASEVVTTMAFHKADVTLTVEDNGVGFAQTPDLMTLARRGKYGIVGLYERAENLEASVDISSQPGAGTRVRVVVPYSSGKVQDIKARVWPGSPTTMSPAPK